MFWSKKVGSGRVWVSAFGVGSLDSEKYGGWSGPLTGPPNDVHAIANVVGGIRSNEVMVSTKVNGGIRGDSGMPTVAALIYSWMWMADNAQPGDLVVLSFSGHGGSIPSSREADGTHETMCLYDGMLTDVYVRTLLARFKSGVRVALVVDSCHSGGMGRDVGGAKTMGSGGGQYPTLDPGLLPRSSGGLTSMRTGKMTLWKAAPEHATRANWAMPSPAKAEQELAIKPTRDRDGLPRAIFVRCDAILLAAASEGIVAFDGYPCGAFVNAIVKGMGSWFGPGSWQDMMRRVSMALPYQRPVLRPLSDGGVRMVREPAFRG